MKTTLVLLILLIGAPPVWAKEEEPSLRVCVPQVDLNYLEFQFQIRPVQGPCNPDEKELLMRRGENGVLEFLPPDPSSPPTYMHTSSPLTSHP